MVATAEKLIHRSDVDNNREAFEPEGIRDTTAQEFIPVNDANAGAASTPRNDGVSEHRVLPPSMHSRYLRLSAS